jgi:hypothetical protein
MDIEYVPDNAMQEITQSLKARIFRVFQAKVEKIFEKAKAELGIVDWESCTTHTARQLHENVSHEWSECLSLLGCRRLETYEDEVRDVIGLNIPDPFWYSGPFYFPVDGSDGYGALAYIELSDELADRVLRSEISL